MGVKKVKSYNITVTAMVELLERSPKYKNIGVTYDHLLILIKYKVIPSFKLSNVYMIHARKTIKFFDKFLEKSHSPTPNSNQSIQKNYQSQVQNC